MMENPATPDKVINPPAHLSTEQIQARLDQAWRALHFEDGLRNLDALITSEQVDKDLVIDVVVAAASRVMRNPEGHSEESGAIDDYRESWKRADDTEDLYFTAAELRRLRPDTQLPPGFTGSFKYS